MPHDIGIISTLSVGFGLALIFGYLSTRLKMPPLIGYIIAGIAIGPFTPGFVGDINLVHQLAEIGVMLLMFGVGLHFSIGDLLSVKKLAIPGAIVQILATILLSIWMAHAWNWPLVSSFVYGLCLSVASTVVLLRALESKGLLNTLNGKIAVGWLIVEDLVMIFALVMLPSVSTILHNDIHGSALFYDLAVTVGKVVLFIGLMLLIGRRIFPWGLSLIVKTNSRELFTLCVIVAAISVAFSAAKLFNVSFALGAFFAGTMLRDSEHSQHVMSESLPLQDIFSVLFFISVGMLLDPSIVLNEPIKLLGTLSIILIGKTLIAILLVLAFRYTFKTAFLIGLSLAQIGEFSFILASLGLSLDLIPRETYNLILAAAIFSIAINSLVFLLVKHHQEPH